MEMHIVWHGKLSFSVIVHFRTNHQLWTILDSNGWQNMLFGLCAVQVAFSSQEIHLVSIEIISSSAGDIDFVSYFVHSPNLILCVVGKPSCNGRNVHTLAFVVSSQRANRLHDQSL